MADLHNLQAIKDVLTPIIDPDRQKSIIELDMVKDIAIKSNGVVSFTLLLNDPNSPKRDSLIQKCKTAIKEIATVTDVWVKVIANSPAVATPTPPTNALQGIEGVKHIFAISSGKGGVGKTSVAVNIAVALADMGAKVGLLDADIYGPNVPLMLGVEAAQVKVVKAENGSDVVEPAFNYGVKAISMAFLIAKDQPVVWRGPMLNGVIRQFLYQANWGELDYLIVDMPPGTGDAQLTLTQSVPLAGAVIVTTPQAVSLLDSRKGLKMFENMGIPVLGIVENMSYFIPPDQPDKQYDIFGSGGGKKASDELGVELLGCVPLEISLREGGDRGVPIVLGHPMSASAKALRDIAKAIAKKVQEQDN
ncbi:MAG: P-loop NTPase [Pseudanabaena sp.]|jgi:ATP-binding protein involved in chromosome partitioning|uniref:Mrp/NBP35 family ATP-binding protein n=1 Tax=Pseudanabaena mucicola TaxID=71190 RepID=UPI0025765AAB|nr:Mrp/NBP35 family ATP-binding protein [Pseudanabaena mucicola]MCA6573141.1 Mrp/NBP35 family ATP-binding protein [Pseudanabaena sp. M53BS1SP1A06MG]MCA6583413.1 Mrp/NBP35 family ATP-binding protein [Pseudanabaena sp. M34BS1SP1A06MG]MCA6593189.1 Mrp/NBP35 family ATP-binding protein [Pseudanabaena sp. M38BS1SP1A06MG]MCA6598719.1 Mrp/NBP35 family ATP-binding protein [Pseudanabaena sp. M57BS1SP1A06MG]